MVLPVNPTGRRRHTRRWESFDDDDEASIAFQVLDSSVEVALIEDSVTSQHGPTCNHVTQNERQPGSMQMRKPL